MTDYSKLLAKIDAIKTETLRDAITPLRLGLILEEMLGRFSVVPPATPDSAWYDFDLWRRAISYGDTDGADRYVLTGLSHTAAADKINLSASLLNMRTGAVIPTALQPLLPVSETAAGLMTPEMLRKLNSASTGSGNVDLSNYYTINQADKKFITTDKIFALSLKAGAFSAATYNPAVKALQVNIPTKLSHLDNDCNFVNSSVIAGFAKESDVNKALALKLDKAVFDDLFVKEPDGKGGYRIRAKYAFYTNEWMSCLGANPDAGSTVTGATTLGGLNNVVAAADEATAAAKVLVREAGASEWSLRNLSDIVGLDTAALAAYLTNNHYAKTSDIPSLAGYLQRSVADTLYQPVGDYALNSALTSAINTLNTAIGKKLDAATFDDLFVKEADGRGGYRIKAKYALYSNQYLSCLGNNPDAGTVALGATTLGGLNNVAAAADEVSAAAKVLVREAGAASWTLKSLSDIVGLDTSALATYLSSNGYAKQSWVEAKGYLTEHQSLADYATKVWVQAQGYLTAITKAQVEAVLTGNITSHTHSQYLTSALAAQTYQPIGDYATNTALNSAVTAINTAIGKKLDAATFDDLFAKESDGHGGYRIKAKYAFYSNQYLSCLGNNPDAGTVALGATTLGGLNNVAAAADEVSAAAKVLVREAGAASWTLKSLSDIVGLDTSALATYLSSNGYAKQSWVEAKGYLTEHQSLADYATKVWVQAQGYVGNELAYLRHRGVTTTNADNTLWSQIGLKSYDNALPDGLSGVYNYGEAISFAGGSVRFDMYVNHHSSDGTQNGKGIYYRSGWGTDKRPWQLLLDTNNYASVLDSRYVKKAGDTMTGVLSIKTDTQPCLKLDSVTANKEVYMYVYSGGVAKNAIGWSPTYGAYIYNSPSLKCLGIKDNGTPHFQGNTLWHSGNDGSGSGLDADMLDNLHLSDIRGEGYAMQGVWIDASGLDQNTWYPVTLPLSVVSNTRIEVLVGLNSSTKPSWSTHGSGFSTHVIWEANGHGWGTTPINRTVYVADYAYTGRNPVRGIGQMSNSSTEYFYVRGGGRYYVRTSNGVVPVLRTSTYTASSQSVGPTTTAPAEIHRDNARIGDNVASATRLQGTYSLWGQSFYGNNVSGNMTGVGNINSAAAPINTIYASNWYRSIGATGWYNETYGGGWYMSDTQWIRAYNNKGIFSQGEFLSGYCFVRDGYAGTSWTRGYGALGVGIINNDQQTPLVMAYRSGTAIDVVGANRLFSMELLNAGTQLRFAFGGTLRFLFTSDGVFSSTTGMYSDGYMSCLGQNTGSDARLKDIIGDVTLPIEVILNAPAVRFAWNASAGPTMAGKIAVGTIAQYWLEPLPEVVGLLPTDYYGLDYEGLNWVATKSLARYAYDGLTDHERRLLTLESENKELKSEINELKRRIVA